MSSLPRWVLVPAVLGGLVGRLRGGDQHQHLLDDVLDAEAGGVDLLDALGGGEELGDGGVVAVAAQHLVGHALARLLGVLEAELLPKPL